VNDGPSHAPSRTPSVPPPSFPPALRMKDLCERTGLPRQAIHFYIQAGLLPAGQKTGRNMALYREEHVARLTLIKNLQHERFLPLKAIKALLDGQESQFSSAQRRLLGEIKQRFTTASLSAARGGGPEPTVRADEACARALVPRADLERAIEIGIIGARQDEQGRTVLAAEDQWLLDAWGEIRRLGYADELGLRIDDVAMLQEVVDDLFHREATLLVSRMERMSPEKGAEMIERALPIVHRLLTGLHTKKINAFFATLSSFEE
jgi:DNA-binding transcriptional MerR regulator